MRKFLKEEPAKPVLGRNWGKNGNGTKDHDEKLQIKKCFKNAFPLHFVEIVIELRSDLSNHLSWSKSQNWHFCWIADTRIIYHPTEEIFARGKTFREILIPRPSFFKLFLYLYNDYDCHSKRVIPVLLRDESSEKISQTCPNSIKVTGLKIPIL